MYYPFNKFLLRTPHYPFCYLGKEAIGKISSNREILEAIYLASPVLYKELKKLENNEIKNSKEKDRIYHSLYKYISRMSTRCTPFGLFATCSIGEIGDKTEIILDDHIKKHMRLDMHYLCTLSQTLSQLSDIKNKINYFPNTSLYKIGKKYRYIEYQYLNKKRVHQISSIDRSVYLDSILEKVKERVNTKNLADYLISQGISEEDSVNFIEKLIDSQIIVPEISPMITGGDYLSFLVNHLDSICSEEKIIPLIKELKSYIDKLNCKQENTFILYKKIIEVITQTEVPYEENFLFQVDTYRNTSSAIVSKEIISELQSSMLFLNKITSVWQNENLSKFQQIFSTRYEDREIPLMEALDPDLGIGYPIGADAGDITPLLDNFTLPIQSSLKNYQSTPFQSLLLSKILVSSSSNKKEIIFTDNDIKPFKENWEDLPLTLFCMFEIIKEDSTGMLIKLNSCSGSCGANLLARFSHINNKIEKWVKDITEKEQELMPDVIIAEIVHLPESRVGNILSRPHIRDYEIIYLANSDLPNKNLIHMSDLMLSVRQGKLYLRSKKLNKEIIPRLTTAHNYHINSMPVYQFLCDLQMQNKRGGVHFDWGYLGNELQYLPRIRYKNTILSLETWKINTEELKYLFLIKDNNQLVIKSEQWRKKYQLPRYVLLSEGDNELFIDWENALSIRAFFSTIKNKQKISFTEFIYDSENVLVKDKNGNGYLNQCIISFYKDSYL